MKIEEGSWSQAGFVGAAPDGSQAPADEGALSLSRGVVYGMAISIGLWIAILMLVFRA